MNAAAPTFRAGQPLIGFPRICVRHISHSGKPRKPTTGFIGPAGHGEKIWIWSHRRTDQTIYTLKDRLDVRLSPVDDSPVLFLLFVCKNIMLSLCLFCSQSYHDLKQIPYNGKKLKPATLRPDYWSPMATIELAPGQGSVGRSIFQKLRELKHLHEVAWPEDVRYKAESEYTKEDMDKAKKAREEGYEYRPMRSKRERGIALNAQRTNSIADLAAVLAGQGRGNKVQGGEGLVPVKVRWANDQDKNYAESWSSNVTHDLFEVPTYVLGDAPKEPTAAV